MVNKAMNESESKKIKRKELFFAVEISSEIFSRIDGKSYKKNSMIDISELTYVQVLHLGFDKNTYIGELIVNKVISEDVLCIFEELYKIKYPIEKIKLIDDYNAIDILSMEDNNSSSFNFRCIDGTQIYSNHAQGRAVDINPLYNPYVRMRNGKEEVLPKSAKKYVNRNLDCLYYIRKNDICYNIFSKYGFTWGGEWEDSKDYQHFEKLK